MAATAALSVTSAVTAIALTPHALSSAAAAVDLASLRPTTAMSAPASASPRAMPRPMPPLPPVTMATLPERSKQFGCHCCCPSDRCPWLSRHPRACLSRRKTWMAGQAGHDDAIALGPARSGSARARPARRRSQPTAVWLIMKLDPARRSRRCPDRSRAARSRARGSQRSEAICASVLLAGRRGIACDCQSAVLAPARARGRDDRLPSGQHPVRTHKKAPANAGAFELVSSGEISTSRRPGHPS